MWHEPVWILVPVDVLGCGIGIANCGIRLVIEGARLRPDSPDEGLPKFEVLNPGSGELRLNFSSLRAAAAMEPAGVS